MKRTSTLVFWCLVSYTMTVLAFPFAVFHLLNGLGMIQGGKLVEFFHTRITRFVKDNGST